MGPFGFLNTRLSAALRQRDEPLVSELEEQLRGADARGELPAYVRVRTAILAYESAYPELFREEVAPRLADILTLRDQWVQRSGPIEVPVSRAPREGAHPLMGKLPDLDTAERVARLYTYDFEGVHVTPHRDPFRIFACGFRDVLGAGADAISYDGERVWPGPRGYFKPRQEDD